MINIGAEDYNVLKQQYIKKYIRLELLDFQYNIVDELSGNMTKCSINVDSTSDLRRSCDLGFVVTTSTFDIKAGSKIFLDKMVRPFVGYENMRTGEIQWYNQGIYLVNNPQWSYDASTNEISMQALDLMSKLTGLRNGNLEGIPTVIAKDENVREAIISTLALGGFTKYICEECKTKDGTIVPVPYDIEIDVGGTIYDILTGLRDIMPNYQIYFDINGVFHYEPIPLAYDDPVLIDDDLFNNVLISENINTDFESVKNYVEVLGHTWDVDYYSPSDKTTVSGGTITPTFTDLKTLENGTAVGITLPVDASESKAPDRVLPVDYTQLTYIKSTGTQYINTGFKPTGNTKVIIDFWTYNQSTTMQGIFGGRPDGNTRFQLFTGRSISSLQCDYKTFGALADPDTSISGLNLKERVKISYSNQLFINDNLIKEVAVQSFNTNINAYLFAINNAGTLQNYASMNLYSCEIYDNNVLVRNFIPCKNPANIVGLYDTVNSVFYSNSGSGSFEAGDEIQNIFDLPENYNQLEYIESSGTQWIDTGFKPNQDTGVIVDADILSTNTGTEHHISTINSGSYYWTLRLRSSRNGYDVRYGNQALTNIASASPVFGRHLFYRNKNVDQIDGQTKVTFNYTTWSSAVNAPIFCLRNTSSTTGYIRMKLYSYKLYDNGMLIRYFIPSKNPDGVIGLYDIVNGAFYQNSGSGVFVAGPEIEKSSGVTINYLGNNKVVDIDDVQLQELTKDTEWIFQYVVQTEGEGESATTTTFWRFMGHQQAQATSYDNNSSSPFYVGDPIGSSSVGRIRIVLYGGEYDNIYSDDLAQQRADFEIYQRSRLNDSISMETIPIPWMDANIVISHRFGQKQEPSKYIVKSFSVDYATGGTMTINAISWYPYYEESEVV